MSFLDGLLQAAGSIGSAILGSNAAGDAQKQFQQATDQSLAFENQVYGTAGNNLQPFVNTGQQGVNALAGLLGIGGNPAASQSAFNNFLKSTNYNFLLNQGLQGTAYLNAPNLFSGATGKALNNYAQGMAGNALGGYEGLLMGLGNQGITAGTNLGNIGTNIANLEQQARFSNANAQAGLGLYGAGQWQSALGNILGSSSFGNAFGGLSNALGNAFGIQSGPTGAGSAFAQQGAMGFGDVAGLF